MIYYFEQGTPEWFEVRRGKFTASNFNDLFMKESTIGFQKAIYKVAFERLTGKSPEEFISNYMQRGNELESEAREFYEMETFNKVHQIGFIEKDEWVGCSPDGLIGEDGMIEIKCPAFNTQINYLLGGSLPSIYDWQVQGQLWITGRAWCDFISYHPDLKPLNIRVYPDITKHKQLAEKLIICIQKTKEIINKIKEIK